MILNGFRGLYTVKLRLSLSRNQNHVELARKYYHQLKLLRRKRVNMMKLSLLCVNTVKSQDEFGRR
ncbi:MAG: hypothetical protein U5L01_16850 [Rheinheimera sp.]|nr:hypothetical protein [Rheinheimera sp.]